jgi:hypothetical protein
MDKAVGMLPLAVRIGGLSKAEILSALHGKGIQLNEIAKDLFAHPGFKTSSERSTIGIAGISVGELGHADGATLEQVFDRAGHQGLTLCPLELAAHLRLQFADQVEGFVGFPTSQNRAPPGSLTVAARPLVKDGMPMGFYLRCISGVPWLRGYRSPAEHVWDAGDRFVFCRPGECASR